MSDKLNILILEKITEVGERTARMESDITHLKDDMNKMQEQDLIQNKLLDEHIRGVNTAQLRLDNEIAARKLLEEKQSLLATKVSLLEEAPKFKATLKEKVIKYIGFVSLVSGTVVGILKILKMLNKF